MNRSPWITTIAAVAAIASADCAQAGMPSIRLSDVAALRLQTISFFLVGFLVSALFIQLLWNALRRDWMVLPRLTYPRALGVVFLWGLLFVFVLTMISGARELMTPGAWVKQGVTYKLAKSSDSGSTVPLDSNIGLETRRLDQLTRLRTALWQYADRNGGKFPNELADLKAEAYTVPDPAGSTYIYVKGLKPGQAATPLVYEPEVFDSYRLVLFANGEIRRVQSSELGRLTAAVQK